MPQCHGLIKYCTPSGLKQWIGRTACVTIEPGLKSWDLKAGVTSSLALQPSTAILDGPLLFLSDPLWCSQRPLICSGSDDMILVWLSLDSWSV